MLKNNGGRCKVQWDTGEIRRDDPGMLRHADERIVPRPFPNAPVDFDAGLTISPFHPAVMVSTSTAAGTVAPKNGSDVVPSGAGPEERAFPTETGFWRTIRGEPPLSEGVYAVITVTVLSDGTIQCQTRSAQGRSIDDVVSDVEKARDRLTEQLNQRFDRCPMFNVANDRSAA